MQFITIDKNLNDYNPIPTEKEVIKQLKNIDIKDYILVDASLANLISNSITN